jgi:ABC-type antimicrobial peptide transport system permease subunit
LIKILIISLFASTVGYVVGAHLSVWLNTSFLITNTQQVAIDWNPLPATVLASMGVALLGQLLPIIKLLGMDPQTILTGD